MSRQYFLSCQNLIESGLNQILTSRCEERTEEVR